LRYLCPLIGDYILNDSLVFNLRLSVCFLSMQIKGNQLSEVMKSASSEAIDLISVSSFILSLMVYHSNLALFDYFILFSTSCSHYAHGILARDQRPQKCSSTPSFRYYYSSTPSLLTSCCSRLPSIIITFLVANF
jgi:uncharacterized protein with PQ loop repeat